VKPNIWVNLFSRMKMERWMNWEAIGAAGELVGALAVFISLIYLATQIRNSKRSDQINAASQAASAVDEWLGQIVRDKELNEMFMRGQTDFDSLSPEEKNRFALLIIQLLRAAEIVWQFHRADAIEKDYWNSFESTIERIVGTVGGTRCYERNSAYLGKGFIAVVDDILSQSKREPGSSR
jgi:hypothetical protein